MTLCQNEADIKCQMDIDSSISLTEQAGKIKLFSQSDFPCLFWGWNLGEISIGNYTSASFRQRVAPTAPFKDWYFRMKNQHISHLIGCILNHREICEQLECYQEGRNYFTNGQVQKNRFEISLKVEHTSRVLLIFSWLLLTQHCSDVDTSKHWIALENIIHATNIKEKTLSIFHKYLSALRISIFCCVVIVTGVFKQQGVNMVNTICELCNDKHHCKILAHFSHIEQFSASWVTPKIARLWSQVQLNSWRNNPTILYTILSH